MPISEKQHAVNCANAARANGPRTPEGKLDSMPEGDGTVLSVEPAFSAVTV